MTISLILAEQARTRPAALAIIDTRKGHVRQLTFRELEQQVAGTADWLQELGLKKGMAALVFVPMSADLYVVLLALFRIGAVALFLDPSAGREHIERCCTRWPPDALIAVPQAHWLRLLSSSIRRIPRRIVIGGWAPFAQRWNAVRPGTTKAPETLSDDHPALVTFTSGSTGVPKGAVRTHGFLVAQHRALVPSIELEAGEIDLATLPIFTLANLASGVTTLIPDVDLRRPGSVDGAKVCAQIREWQVNRITASPAFFERLVPRGPTAPLTLPGLRKLYTGGAPVFPRLLGQMRILAPQAQVVSVYGSTEAEPIAHIAKADIGEKDHEAMQSGRGLLTGATVPEVRLRILRDRWGEPRGVLNVADFTREVMPRGEVGEIVVAGDHVLKGYLGGIGNEETKFTVDGETWHRTGDAGLIDEQDRLWLLGRCAAKIDDARGRLYPFAVECVAMTFPAIRRAAALGHHGKRLLIVETLTRPNDLEHHLRAATAWAGIDAVRFLDRLPVDKRHNAKIDYPALKKMLGG